MRQGNVYYKELLAGILTETDEGKYVFQYEDQYIKSHPNDFITFTMPVTEKPYVDTGYSILLQIIGRSIKMIEWDYY